VWLLELGKGKNGSVYTDTNETFRNEGDEGDPSEGISWRN
jgi:hypothetical protein